MRGLLQYECAEVSPDISQVGEGLITPGGCEQQDESIDGDVRGGEEHPRKDEARLLQVRLTCMCFTPGGSHVVHDGRPGQEIQRRQGGRI